MLIPRYQIKNSSYTLPYQITASTTHQIFEGFNITFNTDMKEAPEVLEFRN
jgi:hypothetical protein